jgi:hypothetical protein
MLAWGPVPVSSEVMCCLQTTSRVEHEYVSYGMIIKLWVEILQGSPSSQDLFKMWLYS